MVPCRGARTAGPTQRHRIFVYRGWATRIGMHTAGAIGEEQGGAIALILTDKTALLMMGGHEQSTMNRGAWQRNRSATTEFTNPLSWSGRTRGHHSRYRWVWAKQSRHAGSKCPANCGLRECVRSAS